MAFYACSKFLFVLIWELFIKLIKTETIWLSMT
nr:MAG TPA: hypothetical protein [Caudoviricetes sp.]